MWSHWKKMKAMGILGLNQRNAHFISQYNPRRYYPLVDDKRRTKELAIEAGIHVPELYGVIEIEHQIDQLESILANRPDFVIKPSHGSGGNGILVIKSHSQGRFRKPDGSILRASQIKHHISNILSGLYSLGGVPDVALLEYRVQSHPLFEEITYLGVPDIRVIVFRGIPALAMARLPTHMSDGKANLHQGAIGVGIDIQTGKTTTGVWKDEPIAEHPDTGKPITGLAIPQWEKLLELAAGAYELTGLGYLGVDIVLDEHKGPLVLELNARPGLNIQIANRCGLNQKLNRIKNLQNLPEKTSERVSFGQEIDSQKATILRV